jgi:hypothetical protein
MPFRLQTRLFAKEELPSLYDESEYQVRRAFGRWVVHY